MTAQPSRPERADAQTMRYQIDVLIGPCPSAEAEDLMEQVADTVIGQLGAVVGLRPYDEQAEARLVAAERERDEASDALQGLAADHYFARAERAEARLVAAEDALRKIQTPGTWQGIIASEYFAATDAGQET